MYMAGITEVRFCVFLPRSLACLNRISVMCIGTTLLFSGIYSFADTCFGFSTST